MNIGNYEILPITVRRIIPGKEQKVSKKKTKPTEDKKKEKSFVSTIHYLYFRHLVSGATWNFVGSQRNKILTFSDGRNTTTNMGARASRMTPEALIIEVARLLGSEANANLAITSMMDNVVKSSDAADVLKPWNDAIEQAKIEVKASNTLSMICNKR